MQYFYIPNGSNPQFFLVNSDEPNNEYIRNPFKTKTLANRFTLNTYNNLAVFLHFLNFIIVLVLCFTYLNDKPENILYVSGKMQLTHTNYAFVDVSSKKTCEDVRTYSSQYQKLVSMDNTSSFAIVDDVLPHNLYDFRNKTIINYNIPEYHIYTYYLIAVFFLLSFLFQSINGMYVGFEGNFPRIMHFIEYSISSSLMILVLAINAGILELYVLVSFFGLFFGMNILGACAEIISWMTAVLFQNKSMKFGWLIPHLAAWVLFLFAYIPILITYEKTRSCSSVPAPAFVSAAVYVELIIFCIFGLFQTVALIWRTFDVEINVCYWIDFVNITLSIFAKTFLAWVLIGPVLSAN